MIGRIISCFTIPLMALTLWGLIRQVRKDQRVRLYTPIIGLVMAPVTLIINLVFLHQAFPGCVGPMLLVLGLGFGGAWGQTTKFYTQGSAVMAKRSALHLIFWGLSYTLTQLLATFASPIVVGGALVTMFFSTGATLGTNLNLLVRQLRIRPKLSENSVQKSRELAQ